VANTTGAASGTLSTQWDSTKEIGSRIQVIH
jgi:hypothetical protein